MNKNISLLAILSVAAIMTIGAVAPALAGDADEEEPISLAKANDAVTENADKTKDAMDKWEEATKKALDDRDEAILNSEDAMCEKIQKEIDILDEKGFDSSDVQALFDAHC